MTQTFLTAFPVEYKFSRISKRPKGTGKCGSSRRTRGNRLRDSNCRITFAEDPSLVKARFVQRPHSLRNRQNLSFVCLANRDPANLSDGFLSGSSFFSGEYFILDRGNICCHNNVRLFQVGRRNFKHLRNQYHGGDRK